MQKSSIWAIAASLLFYIYIHKTSTSAQQIEIFGHDQGGYYNLVTIALSGLNLRF